MVSNRASEIILVAVLLLLMGFVRVYFGNGHTLMVVWKGVFTYQDTFVNLDKYMGMPREELRDKHPSVATQMAEMYLVLPQEGLTKTEIKNIHEGRWRHADQGANGAGSKPPH
jgi:hypothetical protein